MEGRNIADMLSPQLPAFTVCRRLMALVQDGVLEIVGGTKHAPPAAGGQITVEFKFVVRPRESFSPADFSRRMAALAELTRESEELGLYDVPPVMGV